MNSSSPQAMDQMYRKLVEQAYDGFWRLDKEFMTVYVNPALEKMLGYSRTEMVGRSWYDFGDPAWVARAKELERRRESGVQEPHQFLFVHKDGNTVLTRIATTPLYDDEGNFDGAIGILSNLATDAALTERTAQLQTSNNELAFQNKEREKRAVELVIANKELAFQNEEKEKRAAELVVANKELAFQNEEKEKKAAELVVANASLESFNYSISHDLRAPLRSIDGFSLALLEDYEDKLDEGGKDYLRRVRSATQKMAQLIDDILKLSRITRAELTIETVNLSELVETIADELRSAEPGRQVEFIISKGLKVKGDSRLMKVALDNLLGNAWKFTGSHAEGHIEFASSIIDGKTAYFIRDDGAGFDAKYADKLFVTFQRLHTEVEFPGTGIGLSLVQHIINRHGGTVWGEGAVGLGATFWFTIGG